MNKEIIHNKIIFTHIEVYIWSIISVKKKCLENFTSTFCSHRKNLMRKSNQYYFSLLYNLNLNSSIECLVLLVPQNFHFHCWRGGVSSISLFGSEPNMYTQYYIDCNMNIHWTFKRNQLSAENSIQFLLENKIKF